MAAPADIVGLYRLALMVNVAALLFRLGIAMRFRTLQAGPLMQMPVFICSSCAPVYVPQELLSGWVAHVASVNPMTLMLKTSRDFLVGSPPRPGDLPSPSRCRASW